MLKIMFFVILDIIFNRPYKYISLKKGKDVMSNCCHKRYKNINKWKIKDMLNFIINICLLVLRIEYFGETSEFQWVAIVDSTWWTFTVVHVKIFL